MPFPLLSSDHFLHLKIKIQATRIFQEGKSYTVAKFIPGFQGEQVMLEGAEKTALTENVTKAEMDPRVL